MDGFGVHVGRSFRFGFVEFLRRLGEFGLWVGEQGERLLAVDMAFDDAGDVAVFIKQRPARIDGDADVARDVAAIIHQHRQVGVVEATVPFFESGFVIFAEVAGRGDGDEIDAREGLVAAPCLRFFQGGEAERTPACPEFDERRFALVKIVGGGLVARVFQGKQALLQLVRQRGFGAASVRVGKDRQRRDRSGKEHAGDEAAKGLARVFHVWLRVVMGTQIIGNGACVCVWISGAGVSVKENPPNGGLLLARLA